MPATHPEWTFDRPFPALTAAQRYHFDLYGYVIIENTLSADEVAACKQALYELRDALRKLDDPGHDGPRYHNAYLGGAADGHHSYLSHILEAHPTVTAYATHPRLVGMAEEIIGGDARIVEMNAQINRKAPTWPADEQGRPTYGLHRGAAPHSGMHMRHGLVHCNFVKTLTNLTDLGPDDGGTVVVAGSHKIDLPAEELIAAAYEDRSLLHQVVAPAGSTLLFAETLLHATGQIRSDKERVILICGYGTRLFPYWDHGQLSEAFVESIPPQLYTLFHGWPNWVPGHRYRQLGDAVDERPFAMGRWDDRVAVKSSDRP